MRDNSFRTNGNNIIYMRGNFRTGGKRRCKRDTSFATGWIGGNSPTTERRYCCCCAVAILLDRIPFTQNLIENKKPSQVGRCDKDRKKKKIRSRRRDRKKKIRTKVFPCLYSTSTQSLAPKKQKKKKRYAIYARGNKVTTRVLTKKNKHTAGIREERGRGERYAAV